MKSNKRAIQVIFTASLVIAVVCISVGFAMMSTSLQIQGAAKVVPASWDIKFTNKTFSNNNTFAAEGSVTPTFNDTTFSNYEVILTRPGDRGTYLVTVTNGGDIDARISTVTLGNTLTVTGSSAADEEIVRSNIIYNVTWEDGSAISQDDVLLHGESRKIKIDIAYDENATQLPAQYVTVTGRDLTVLFVQHA